MDINVKVAGMKELASRWARMPANLKTLTGEAFQKAGYLVERESKLLTPVKSGRLKSSINTSSRLSMKGEPHIVISPHTNYAWAVHERKAKHTTGDWKYMTRGFEKAKPKISSILNRLLKDIIRILK